MTSNTHTVIHMTSVETWLLINHADGTFIRSRKSCISFEAADKETLIFPSQHNIAYPDILILLNLDCDELKKTE